MGKAIIGNAVINRARIVAEETEEQRRIAALEERVTVLETALAGTQAQIIFGEGQAKIVNPDGSIELVLGQS